MMKEVEFGFLFCLEGENMELNLQLNGMLPISDYENIRNVRKLLQADAVCVELRNEESSYEEFIKEYNLLEKMIKDRLSEIPVEHMSDFVNSLYDGDDLFSKVYQTYLWAKSIVDLCGLSEKDFLKEISKLCSNFESDDPEKVDCFVVTFSDILCLLKKKYIHFEGIDVIEEYISDWNELLDNF